MKVVIFVDKIGSAIWKLAEAVRVNTDYMDIRVFPVHPKRNDIETLVEAQNLMNWADIIDIHYWKSGEILKTSFPSEFNSKPKILFHFNPYDLDKQDWMDTYDKVVVGNQSMQNKIPYSSLIPYAVNLKFFAINEKYTEEKTVQMAVNRIESKKGVLEVAQACKINGYKFLLIGRVSEPNYMHEIISCGAKIEFIENATEEVLRDSYYNSAIHVCNSIDGFESGTLPILEAMACGTPVLTRNIGHVPDLFNGENMQIMNSDKSNIDEIAKELKALMENREWRLKLREKAWETVKIRDERKMVWDITSLYYSLWVDNRPLVSIITPTYDNPESLIDNLVGTINQDYGKLEIIVTDSGVTSVEPIISKLREKTNIPIKYIRFKAKGYTLAEARNRAVIEAQGEILVFCDDRLLMERNAVSKFAEDNQNKYWQWGIKDGAVKGFVENFSSVNRQDFINGGMFNERVDKYGGMSQEIRTRYENKQGFVLELNNQANATSIKRTKSKFSRRQDIIDSKLLLYKLYK